MSNPKVLHGVRTGLWIVMALTSVTVVALALTPEPAKLVQDILLSVTGFAAGFLYASHLYYPRGRDRL